MSTQQMSVEETRAVLEPYIDSGHSDVRMIAPDCVFRVMATGDEYRGPDAILGMLDYFYRGAFQAEAKLRNLVFGEGRAFGEWDFVGKHVGEFAGVPATGKDVHVPLAVAYDVYGGKVTEARVYFEIPAFLAQVGALG